MSATRKRNTHLMISPRRRNKHEVARVKTLIETKIAISGHLLHLSSELLARAKKETLAAKRLSRLYPRQALLSV